MKHLNHMLQVCSGKKLKFILIKHMNHMKQVELFKKLKSYTYETNK